MTHAEQKEWFYLRELLGHAPERLTQAQMMKLMEYNQQLLMFGRTKEWNRGIR